MTRSPLRILLSLASATVLAACAPASPGAPSPAVPSPEAATRLEVDRTTRGSLDADAPLFGDRGRFHRYQFQAREGQRFILELESDDFDSYLVVGDQSAGLFAPIASDDDGGDGVDSRLRFVAPRTGTFTVLAQALGEDDVGAYSLTLHALPAPRAATPTPVAIGGATNGALTLEDALLEEEDSYYDLYTFQARAGQRYAVRLDSDDFDAYLEAGPFGAGAVDVVETDDDGGTAANARLVFTPSQGGTWAIRARSYASGATGDYTLHVDEAPEPGPTEVRAIAFGETLAGELTLSDNTLEDDSYFDLYTFSARAGDEIVITLHSDDFDAFLTLGRLLPGEFEMVVFDDDSAENGLDAEIRFRVLVSGEYGARANSVGPGSTGRYEIRLQKD